MAAEIEALAEEAMPEEGGWGWATAMCSVVEAQVHGDLELLRAYCNFKGRRQFDDVRGALKALRAARGDDTVEELREVAVDAFVAVEAARSEADEHGEDTHQYGALAQAAVTRPEDIGLILAAAPRAIEDYEELVGVLDEMAGSAKVLQAGAL